MGEASRRYLVGNSFPSCMTRRLLNFLTVLSLVFCVALVVLLARSHGRLDGVSRYPYLADRRIYRQDRLFSENGILWAQFRHTTIPSDAVARRMGALAATGSFENRWRRYSSYSSGTWWPVQHGWERLGFRARWRSEPAREIDPLGQTSELVLGLPHWFAVAVLLLVPAARGKVLVQACRRYRRRRTGRCTYCGYDLRATPNVCPECGVVVSSRRPRVSDV